MGVANLKEWQPARQCLVAWLSVLLVAVATLPSHGQRRSGASAGTPVATNTVAAAPDAYYGKTVTMSAHVEEILSKTVFVIDQRKVAPGTKEVRSIGHPMLVVALTLGGEVERSTYVTLVGEVVKLEWAELAKKMGDYSLNLQPGIMAKFEGRPALLATSVRNNRYVELAKPRPPPD